MGKSNVVLVVAVPVVAIAVALIGGCATSAPSATAPEPPRSGQVTALPVVRIGGVDRLQLPANETFNMPLAEGGNAPPAYPAALLQQHLPPQVVCLRVSIGTDGEVTATAPVAQAPQCAQPSGINPAFAASAAEAVQEWRFDPAFRCIYPDAASVQPGCAPGMPHVEQAVSLVYRFVFEQHGGQGSVQVSQ